MRCRWFPASGCSPKDESDVGLKQGWEKPGFDDTNWTPIAAGTSWERQKIEKYDGIGWLRQRAMVPAAWKDLPLRIRLGAVTNYVNNAEVLSTAGAWENQPG